MHSELKFGKKCNLGKSHCLLLKAKNKYIYIYNIHVFFYFFNGAAPKKPAEYRNFKKKTVDFSH